MIIRQWLIYRNGEYLSDFFGTRREAEQFSAREYGSGCVVLTDHLCN